MTPRRLALALFAVLTLLLTPPTRAAEPPLRTGDVLALSLPGEAALTGRFAVDRQGRVALPEIGSVAVAGLAPDQAAAKIRAALAAAFRDLERLQVTLAERRLSVTVLGYVKTPGPVELPADATVQMALNAAGGLAQGAQLDRVQLRRGAEVRVFDYKKYLDTGDPALLPALLPLDTVFVPASPLTGAVQIDFDGRTLAQAGDGADDRQAVKVFGEVNNPAQFAFKAGATAVDMIMRAGGVTRYAAVEQIRVIAGGRPTVFNLQTYLDTGDTAKLPELAPGATIFVPRQMEEIRRGALTVYVMGEVAKPGAFETKADATFIDILANAGGPTRFADTRQIRVIRAAGKVETVDLPAFAEGGPAKLPPVKPGDAIFVPEKPDAVEPSWLKVPPSRAVRVVGAVTRPGRFEWSDEMSLLDVVAHAGGPTARADVANVRVTIDGKARRFDLGRFLDHGGDLAALPRLKAGATIHVPELPQDPSDNKAQWTRLGADRAIHVMGAVGAPGRYAFNAQLTLIDLISAANGPTPAADLRGLRITHRGEGGARVTKVNLSRYFQTGDETLLPKVKPGDVVYVPDRNRDWIEADAADTVRVLGAVGKPGRYRHADDMTILDLLAEAGGPTPNAYQEKIVVVNLSCCAQQARTFDLVGFARSGDLAMLPLVRPGDTIYVPDVSQSDWKIFMNGVRDALSVVSIFALVGGL